MVWVGRGGSGLVWLVGGGRGGEGHIHEGNWRNNTRGGERNQVNFGFAFSLDLWSVQRSSLWGSC